MLPKLLFWCYLIQVSQLWKKPLVSQSYKDDYDSGDKESGFGVGTVNEDFDAQ